jgi:hypothetical protein
MYKYILYMYKGAGKLETSDRISNRPDPALVWHQEASFDLVGSFRVSFCEVCVVRVTFLRLV